MIAITGKTFPVRDVLRDMGCKWDNQAKLWYAPKHIAAVAQKLVKSQGRASVPPRSIRRSVSYCYGDCQS
ncbi:MAG: hypothetical protein M0P16_03430 [Syntrophales bacterium]|jgi:hypothetical protein|nr:hypothetical protein [Syntrophales bacterium]